MALTPQEAVERDAAEWAVAIDRGLSHDEQATLDIWLAGDLRRQGALVRARAIWLAAAGPEPQERVVRFPAPRVASRRWVMGGAMAAGLAATLGLGVHLARRDTVRTRGGEVRRVALEDGSQAVLNARTRMVVHLTETRRSIDLRSGEAWFEVARDATRPFVVSTTAATVTAVGTAFSVREIGDVTEVVVTEGTVAIDPADGRPATYVTAGNAIRIDRSHPLQKAELDASRVRRRLAWREGLIMLDGETLGEAAVEFNRYGGRRIVVAPEIADNRVVGVFRIHDAEGFARANADLLSLNISMSTDEIRLTP